MAGKIHTWDAFCTIHWFVTGQRIIALSNDPLTSRLYAWWLQHTDAIYLDVVLGYDK